MQYCVLSTSRGTGTLTCKVEGVRPKVQLEFREVIESQSRKVNFKPPETTITVKENLFDVSVTSEYEVLESVLDSQITIECAVVGAGVDIDNFGTPARFDLLITSSNDVPVVTSQGGGLQFLWFLILLPCLVVLLGLVYFCKGIPDVTKCSPDVIQKFIQQLKTKYEGFYNAVYPVPYIRDRMYCVNTIFVESGIQEMKSHDKWIDLKSYQKILENAVNRSARIILEGEPGFGKSTLSLQLVYDWCEGISSSPLANVQIVIFLRLRQVGGVTSIAQAVKQFILPRDSSIKVDDIQTILQNCSSIVIILDGFDEYPDKDNDVVISEFKNIIKGDIFQDVCLLVTTRAKCMPKEYAPQSKRMRLVGFNSDAQRSYIRKAVVVDNPSKGKAILRRLNENTILSDLCQVPLFFVLFAHITFEDEKFEKFTSVSTCFGYVIGCFHEHLRLKSDDKNVKPYQKDHKSLDKVAFDALNGELQQLSWSKDDLLEHLGKEFYSYYVQLGMLVEEEVHNRDPLNSTSLSHYQTEVRFCHKVFCEWFAAHNFADIVSEDDTVLSKKGINPFDSQYVYRFACGLKPEAAEKIISYVSDLEDGEKFAILCFLEQTGKTDKVLETIKTICQSEVIFDGSDSKLLQRSTVQLLEMASTNGIEISRVELYDCVRSADLALGHLVLSSGIHFHKLSSINQLVIYDEGKHVIYEKARGIINFGMLCHDLRTLAFYRCIMPQTLGRLQHNFSVWWSPSTDTRYNLTQSGKWETTEGKKLSDEQYQLEVRKITQQSQSRDTNGHKPGTEANTA
ncbi:hypothetical protein BSL78_18883 [Apostichopus japonicus]|uniref:NACHT domain-containing protein n=1 Tax=Stichopus japonicus TaxID=307972 RepID=A0A2G8K8K3_STIJA|nr:hypothetical protein BSL78_18883 [Apostichopus japonicus]